MSAKCDEGFAILESPSVAVFTGVRGRERKYTTVETVTYSATGAHNYNSDPTTFDSLAFPGRVVHSMVLVTDGTYWKPSKTLPGYIEAWQV